MRAATLQTTEMGLAYQGANLCLPLSFLRRLPRKMWKHLCKMLTQGFAFAMIWPLVPQFVCNGLFYWALYLSPVISIDLVVHQLLHPET